MCVIGASKTAHWIKELALSLKEQTCKLSCDFMHAAVPMHTHRNAVKVCLVCFCRRLVLIEQFSSVLYNLP